MSKHIPMSPIRSARPGRRSASRCGGVLEAARTPELTPLVHKGFPYDSAYMLQGVFYSAWGWR